MFSLAMQSLQTRRVSGRGSYCASVHTPSVVQHFLGCVVDALWQGEDLSFRARHREQVREQDGRGIPERVRDAAGVIHHAELLAAVCAASDQWQEGPGSPKVGPSQEQQV